MRKRLRPGLAVALALALALGIELLGFNCKALFTLGREWQPLPEPIVTDRLEERGALELVFELPEVPVETCHLLLVVQNAKGRNLETSFTVWLRDEGSAVQYYKAGTVSYSPLHDKGSWFRLNSYGGVKQLRLTLNTQAGAVWRLAAAEINGSIPFRISLPRVLGLFALFCLLWALRPGSVVHDNRFWARRPLGRALCVLLVLALNLSALCLLCSYNKTFINIPTGNYWSQHREYARLARALAEGRVNIDTEADREALALLEGLENPYDLGARSAAFEAAEETAPWDIAYYNDRLYVYFGVVPVLLTYLPWYLLTGNDLPNVWAVVFSFGLTVLGAFALVRALIRRHFPETPFSVWVLLSLLLGNCTCLFSFVLAPSFYVLPITFSLAFVSFGLALWISAAERWSLALDGPGKPGDPALRCFAPVRGSAGVGLRIALGSLLAALTAGCRPQFLLFSLLALPIFLPFCRREPRRSRTLSRAACLAIPYVLTAAGVMYYNAIRFGSPLDFGANYNLTTNSMIHRGWRWGRLPDGLLEYLFRLPSLDLRFPYLHVTATEPLYLGLTIRENTFGGVLLLCPFLWILLRWKRARSLLRRERLWGLALLPLPLSLVVVAADTEMAGIVWRYVGDFLPLLCLSAALVFLARWRGGGVRTRRRLTVFLLFCLLFTLGAFFAVSVTESGLQTRNPDAYYRLRDLFDLA